MRGPRPRTFEEVVAAQDPTEMARLERREHFTDPSVNPFHGEVSINEDRHGSGEWRVEYFDDDGGCYVVRRRVHTRHGWRVRRVEVCG